MVKKILNNFLNILENNEYLILYLTSIIILYVCFVGDEIPYFIEDIFKNKIVKLVLVGLIVFRVPNNTFMSIMYTLAFLVTIDRSSNNKIKKIKEKENNKETKKLEQKENFEEKEFSKEDFSYNNELNKLIKLKENFSQSQVEELNVLNCEIKYPNYEEDFGNSKNTNNSERMFYIESRCSDKNFPSPDELIKKINNYEEKYKKNNDELYLEKINDEKYKYNVYRKIFKDYKNFEFENKSIIKKLKWIENL